MKEEKKVRKPRCGSRSYSSSDNITVVYGTTRRHLVNTYSRELGTRGIFIFIRLRCDWHWYECAMPIMARARRITMRCCLRFEYRLKRAARYSGIEVTAPWEYSYCAIFSWIIATITTKGEKRARSKTATIMKIVTLTSLSAKTLRRVFPIAHWLKTIVRSKAVIWWQSASRCTEPRDTP